MKRDNGQGIGLFLVSFSHFALRNGFETTSQALPEKTQQNPLFSLSSQPQAFSKSYGHRCWQTHLNNLIPDYNQVKQKFITMAQVSQPQKRLKVLLFQVFAGLCSGFSVSPLNVVVDKSVIEYTSGKGNMWTLAGHNLATIVKSPITFLSGFSFRWMYFVYASTYTASNLADHVNLTSQVSHPIQKLAIVFLVNTVCGLIKDKKYAVKYGNNVSRPFPPISYGLFFIRDIAAMASAFTIPPMLGKAITQRIDVSPQNGERMGQLISPIIAQFFTTPLHLLGLDIYNRPGQSLAERYKYIKGIFNNSLVIRMMRFLPAYGFGGIINIELRRYLKGEGKSH